MTAEERNARIVILYLDGVLIRDIAIQFDISTTAVNNILNKNHVERARYNYATPREIKKMCSRKFKGAPNSRIANDLGISRQRVSRLLKKHYPEYLTARKDLV